MAAPIVWLLAAAAATTAVVVVAGKSNAAPPQPDDDDLPDRAQVWSTEHVATLDVSAPGWHADVTTQEGNLCGTNASKPFGRIDCDDGGRWTPVPKLFRLRLAAAPAESVVVRAEIRVTDGIGVTNRLRYHTLKATSGRKRGTLDINEYDLEGPAVETAWCETLARRFPVVQGRATQGPLIQQQPTPCGGVAMRAQTYSLYRAQRDTSLNGLGNETREWFAKVDRNRPAYSARVPMPAGAAYVGLFGLQLGLDDGGIYIAGSVAASLAPQQLHVQAIWQTRPI